MENYQTILGTQGQDTLVNLISIKLPACAVNPLASVKLLAYSNLPPHHCSCRARCQQGFCLQNLMLWSLWATTGSLIPECSLSQVEQRL